LAARSLGCALCHGATTGVSSAQRDDARHASKGCRRSSFQYSSILFCLVMLLFITFLFIAMFVLIMLLVVLVVLVVFDAVLGVEDQPGRFEKRRSSQTGHWAVTPRDSLCMRSLDTSDLEVRHGGRERGYLLARAK
jgi:hypothetical protein